MLLAGSTLTISASVGIAMFPTDGYDMKTLLHHADIAMYHAKRQGHGQFCFFSSKLQQTQRPN